MRKGLQQILLCGREFCFELHPGVRCSCWTQFMSVSPSFACPVCAACTQPLWSQAPQHTHRAPPWTLLLALSETLHRGQSTFYLPCLATPCHEQRVFHHQALEHRHTSRLAPDEGASARSSGCLRTATHTARACKAWGSAWWCWCIGGSSLRSTHFVPAQLEESVLPRTAAGLPLSQAGRQLSTATCHPHKQTLCISRPALLRHELALLHVGQGLSRDSNRSGVAGRHSFAADVCHFPHLHTRLRRGRP